MYKKGTTPFSQASALASPSTTSFVTKSMMGIMGRMATYTGQQITWDGLMRSREKLGPDHYEFGSMAVEPVAMPGKTKLV